MRRELFRRLMLILAMDVVLPYAVYLVLHRLGFGDVTSLAAGGCVPLVRVILVATRERRIEGLALFVLALFAVGAGTSLLTGDARFILAKDSALTAAIGLVLLGSLVVGRPVAFYGLRQFAPGYAPEFWEERWRNSRGFRRGLRLMTGVWAAGLLVEAAARIVAAYTLPVEVAASLSMVFTVAVFAVLGLWSGVYGRRARTRRETRLQTNE